MGKGEFDANYGDTKPQAPSGFADIPAKTKVLAKVAKAVGAKSTAGNPYVTVNWEVHAGEWAGRKINFQNITFLPKDHKYAGIALHALKCLLQPHEGAFKVRPDNWVGQFAYITVGVETKDYKGEPTDFNKVDRIDVVPPRELQMLGVPDDAIPDWLWKAQDVLDKKTPGNDTTKARAPESTAAAKDAKPTEPKPDAECETCERKYADHKSVKHAFTEKLPF